MRKKNRRGRRGRREKELLKTVDEYVLIFK